MKFKPELLEVKDDPVHAGRVEVYYNGYYCGSWQRKPPRSVQKQITMQVTGWCSFGGSSVAFYEFYRDCLFEVARLLG